MVIPSGEHVFILKCGTHRLSTLVLIVTGSSVGLMSVMSTIVNTNLSVTAGRGRCALPSSVGLSGSTASHTCIKSLDLFAH